MAGDEFRIFLSAVTNEFGSARDAVANDLQACGLQVRVQRSFRQEPGADTLLRKLHDYIRDCSAVVCMIGTRSGACPTAAEAETFAAMLPDGISEASYTQWEFFFARHYKRRLSLYFATSDYKPDDANLSPGDRPGLQRHFVAYIKSLGLDRLPVSNRDQLRAEVLKESWPHKRPGKPILLPYQSIGSLFKGRGDFMDRLHASLTRGNGAQTAIVSTALHGLGGVGKTRAAVEYAWAHRDDYTALLFAIAETPAALRANIAALAGLLVLPEREATDEELRLRAVLDWLKANPGWLLILDNVGAPQARAEAQRIMGQLTGGHIVMTSRFANFAADVEPLELDVLSVEDAADFLMERTAGRRRPAADDATRARTLAKELGQLALALEHAGAYIAKHRLTFAQYQELLRANRDKVLDWSDPTITHYPRAIALTWQTSVAQLSEAARHLLELLGWLAPNPVPEFLLEVAIPESNSAYLLEALANFGSISPEFVLEVAIPESGSADLLEALTDLASYSLATRAAGEPQFSVHRLVQDVTRRSLADDPAHARLVEALNWVNAAFEGDPQDVRTWARLDPLASHALAVTQHADACEVSAPTSTLMNQLGVLFNAKARHSEAEPLMRRALAIDEKAFGPDHPNVAIRLSNLATLLQATNRLAEAEPLMRRALAIDEKAFGPEHPKVTIRLGNLATLLYDTNRLAEAEPLMRRALAIGETAFGPDHPKVAIRLANLATLLYDTNRLGAAEPLMRRALAIDEKAFGPDHPNVAIRLNNLARLLKSTNRLAEAEALMRRALAIDEKAFGPDHPKVAIRFSNLAQLLHDTNRLAEAEPLMRRALAIDELAFEPDHPNVAIRLNNLARLLHDTNRLAEAEPLMRRALAIFVEFGRGTGHRHPQYDQALINYLSLLQAMGKSAAEISAAIESLTGKPS